MSDIKRAYKAVALEVWQLCIAEPSEDLARLKPMRRLKVKNKKTHEQNLN